MVELLVNGKRVFAATGGRPFEAGRPAMVMIHGAGMDHTIWSMQARYFAHHGFSVLNPDLPGHGRSSGVAPDSIPAYADWLAALLDASGARRVHLVGHSMGSLIALAYAAQARTRAATEAAATGAAATGAATEAAGPGAATGAVRVALLGTLAHIQVHPGLLESARNNDHSAYETVVSRGVGRRAQIGGSRAPGAWVAGASMRLLEAGAAGILANDLAACNDWTDGLVAAGKVGCPVLLLAGSDDRMTPAKGVATLAAALSDSRTVTLHGAGHMMMIEQPDQTLDALAAFFDAA